MLDFTRYSNTMDANYVARLQAGARRISDCINISVTDLYFDDNMNNEMERLFGFPVFEEHKEIINRERKYGNTVAVSAPTPAGNTLSNMVPDLHLYLRKPSFLYDYSSTQATYANDHQRFNEPDLSVFASMTMPSPRLLSLNGSGLLQVPAYKYYAANLILQELRRVCAFRQTKTANLINRNSHLALPSYSKVLQKYKPPHERTFFENASLNNDSSVMSYSPSFEKKSVAYKCFHDESNIFQPPLEDSAVEEVTGPVPRFALSLSDTVSKNITKKIIWKKNMCCKFCYANKANPKACKNHTLEDEDGNVVCLKLRRLVCSNCGATSDIAPTYKYGPQNDFDLLDEDSTED